MQFELDILQNHSTGKQERPTFGALLSARRIWALRTGRTDLTAFTYQREVTQLALARTVECVWTLVAGRARQTLRGVLRAVCVRARAAGVRRLRRIWADAAVAAGGAHCGASKRVGTWHALQLGHSRRLAVEAGGTLRTEHGCDGNT